MREILQQALDALLDANNMALMELSIDDAYSNEIDTLRQALAQPEQDHGFDRTASHMAGEYVDTANQEPVAWHYHNPDYPIQDGDWVEVIFTSGQPDDAKKWTPLYTAPSKPEQEPAAIVDDEGFAWGYGIEGGRLPSGTKVYTAPQNPDVTLISEGKTWQGLTSEEIELCREKAFSINNPYCPVDRKSMWKAAQYIQAKLREKNT